MSFIGTNAMFVAPAASLPCLPTASRRYIALSKSGHSSDAACAWFRLLVALFRPHHFWFVSRESRILATPFSTR